MSDEKPEISYETIPDAATVERAHARHQANLASINEHDPNSIVYQRPDLAAQYRARIQSDFERVTRAHGAVLPPPKTEADIRREEFDARWGGQARIDEIRKSVFEALTPDVGLDRYQIAYRAEQLEKELGQERYAELVAAAGGTATVLPIALGNRFALERLAATATYEAAYLKAKAAAKL